MSVKNKAGQKMNNRELIQGLQEQDQDAINHPAHYTQGDIECWDAMRACMSADEFAGYLRGCAIKYLWRCTDKGTYAQDLQKARAYVDKLIEAIEA